jgi:hypothetical protein
MYKEWNAKICLNCINFRAEQDKHTKTQTGLTFCLVWDSYRSWWQYCTSQFLDKRPEQAAKEVVFAPIAQLELECEATNFEAESSNLSGSSIED